MLRYLTAGESHGPAAIAILEGFPAGMPLCVEDINTDLARRQVGYGRGGRMKIETDRVTILSGLRFGQTLGSPLTLQINNKDHEKWQKVMSQIAEDRPKAKTYPIPRPGHADLAGGMKYNRKDLRDILERASARETAARVAAGAVCRKLLSLLGIEITSHVRRLGGIEARVENLDFESIRGAAEDSGLRCVDAEAAEKMRALIDKTKEDGDTLGGVVEIITTALPPGLGSHVQWDRKLDGRLAQAIMSIQAIKGVEIGPGFANAERPGSGVHDEIEYSDGSFHRRTNRAGGTEGGMTNGEPLCIRAAMKPIATVLKSLDSVHVEKKKPTCTRYERSDVTAVPAAGVVAESAVAFVLAQAVLEKFGGDSLDELRRNYEGYLEQVAQY
jgi:chorismate synthase